METGYDITDPKSPGFHDRMSDLWDSRDKTLPENRRNPLIHWEVTVLEGVAERFATNSLPLAVRILEGMGKSGSDLATFALIVQPSPGDWPRSLTYAEACAEARD